MFFLMSNLKPIAFCSALMRRAVRLHLKYSLKYYNFKIFLFCWFSGRCGNPGKILNGIKTGTDYRHDRKVKYRCSGRGYVIVGADTLTCDNGRWDKSIPNCGGEPLTDFTIDAKVTLSILWSNENASAMIPFLLWYICMGGYCLKRMFEATLIL